MQVSCVLTLLVQEKNPKDLDHVPPPRRPNIKGMPSGIIWNSDQASAQASANNTSTCSSQDSPTVIDDVQMGTTDEDIEVIYVDED